MIVHTPSCCLQVGTKEGHTNTQNHMTVVRFISQLMTVTLHGMVPQSELSGSKMGVLQWVGHDHQKAVLLPW